MMKRIVMIGVLLLWLVWVSPLEAFNFIETDGVGNEGQGAAMVIYDIDGNGKPDLIVMAYDNPAGANTFRYRIGWNIESNGKPSSWSSSYIKVDGVGHEGQGAGMAIANFDSNPRPEMVLMAYDKAGEFRYKIGWNLTTAGVATSWSETIKVDGIGKSAQGAGVAIYDIDGNGKPDMVFMIYDNPAGANSFRYKIGWDIGSNGKATSWSSSYIQVEGVGHEGQGADIALCNLDSNPQPEMVLMAYDKSGEFRYKIGWNISKTGTAMSWSAPVYLQGVGSFAQGAGVAVYPVEPHSLYFMMYDNPAGPNSFRIVINDDIILNADDSSLAKTNRFTPPGNGYFWMQNTKDYVSFRTSVNESIQLATDDHEVKVQVTTNVPGSSSTRYIKIQPYRCIKYRLTAGGQYKFLIESGRVLGIQFPSKVSELSYPPLPKNRPLVAANRNEYAYVLPYDYWNDLAQKDLQMRLNFYDGLIQTHENLKNINLYHVALTSILNQFGALYMPATTKDWVLDQVLSSVNNGLGTYFEVVGSTAGMVASELLGGLFLAKDYVTWSKNILTKGISASISDINTADYLRTSGADIFYRIRSQAQTLRSLTEQELNARKQKDRRQVIASLDSQIATLVGPSGYTIPKPDPVKHTSLQVQPLVYEAILQNILFKRVINDNKSTRSSLAESTVRAATIMEEITAKTAVAATDISVIARRIKDIENLY